MNERQSRIYRAIKKARGHDWVRVEFGPAPNGNFADLDHLAVRHGWAVLGDDWIEVDGDYVRSRLAYILTYSLAYGSVILEEQKAKMLANQFMAIFGSPARFYTNFEPDDSGGRSGCGITTFTFDEAIAVIDSTHVGIVIVMDED